jgi:hypothetical protein
MRRRLRGNLLDGVVGGIVAKRRYLAISLLIVISIAAGALVGGRMVVAQSAQIQSLKAVEVPSSQKWEYRVLDLGYDKAQTIANDLGDQGFELVNFTKSPYSKECTFVFRRPKSQ